jgi:hypothetical protein
MYFCSEVNGGGRKHGSIKRLVVPLTVSRKVTSTSTTYLCFNTSTVIPASRLFLIFLGLMMPSGQELAFGLLATITLKVVPFPVYAPFQALLPCFNASRMSCSVWVFSTAYDYASLNSIVSKWRPFGFIFNRGKNTDRTNVLLYSS